ncbi:MAG: DUF6702 family protein [Crocinitomicaceae bacterium]
MMKSFLLFLVFTCLLAPSRSWGHQYFFAFAEVEYNEMGQKFEGSIMATAHDLELTLMNAYGLKTKLENVAPNSPDFNIMEDYLNQFLTLNYGCSLDSNVVDANCTANWTIESFQLMKNGNIALYFSAPAKHVYTLIQVDFRFLMDAFPEQQNKLTFIYREDRNTLSFTKAQPQQYFALKP